MTAGNYGVSYSAKYSYDIKTVVIPECLILDGDERIDEVIREILEFDVGARFTAADGGDDIAFVIVEH